MFKIEIVCLNILWFFYLNENNISWIRYFWVFLIEVILENCLNFERNKFFFENKKCDIEDELVDLIWKLFWL